MKTLCCAVIKVFLHVLSSRPFPCKSPEVSKCGPVEGFSTGAARKYVLRGKKKRKPISRSNENGLVLNFSPADTEDQST